MPKNISRVIIENVGPEIEGGIYSAKRSVGENLTVTADIFADGHDELTAVVLYKKEKSKDWQFTPMEHLGNDHWQAEFEPSGQRTYIYTVQAWVDHFKTWQKDLGKRLSAGQDAAVDLLIGVEFLVLAIEKASKDDKKYLQQTKLLFQDKQRYSEAIEEALSSKLTELMLFYPDKTNAYTYPKELKVIAERERARFGAWYEMFPRSCSPDIQRSGTLQDCLELLPEIAQMGFDVLYLPPVHPIGVTKRKGKNNNPEAKEGEPGSPWAIGSKAGGHKAIEPSLGSVADFEILVKTTQKYGLEIAMDLALQCSPDHPYVKKYPQWFKKRPDGTIQYAENPPKKYEDIVPFNFETYDWQALWDEIKSIVEFWVEKGVKIFRVDNPHSKPFALWEWLIKEIQKKNPEVIFLAEAFTRPKVMNRLAKIGFTQSYTYFTWRNTKQELMAYMTTLTKGDEKDYFRPNFWPNTPDILTPYLQHGGRPAHIIRLILAATLSANYGIYGPVYELCVNTPYPGKEENLDSEKYEIKHWNRYHDGSLRDIIARLNQIRRENTALQFTNNIRFCETSDDSLIAYAKEMGGNKILVVVNLDPYHPHSGFITLPLKELGLEEQVAYEVHDLMSNDGYYWQGERNFVELNPHIFPAHIFVINRPENEQGYDYY